MATRDLGTPAVDLREDEGVWWSTFDRPEASNAFTLADLDRLSEIFEGAGARPRAAVLTGAGPASFSAGMHLAAFSELTPPRARQKKLFEIWQNHALTAGIDMSVDVFAGVFASTEAYAQIERHRQAIGRQPRPGPAGLV